MKHTFVLLTVLLSCLFFCNSAEIKELEAAIEDIQSSCDNHLNLNAKIREVFHQRLEYEEILQHFEAKETEIFQRELSNALIFEIEKSECEYKKQELQEKCEEKKNIFDVKHKGINSRFAALHSQNMNCPDKKYPENLERLYRQKSKLEREEKEIDFYCYRFKEKIDAIIDHLKVKKYKFKEMLGEEIQDLKNKNSQAIEINNELCDQKWTLLHEQRNLSKISLQKHMKFKKIQEQLEYIWKHKFSEQKQRFDSAIAGIHKCFAYIFATSIDGKILSTEEEKNLQNDLKILMESLRFLKQIILVEDL